MPDVTQYKFTYHEVVEALIKKTGLHEGKWQLIMSFGLAALNAGPGPDEVTPAAMVGVTSIGLKKAEPDSPPSLTVDAALVNPAST